MILPSGPRRPVAGFHQEDHVWVVPVEGGQPVRISDFTTNAGTLLAARQPASAGHRAPEWLQPDHADRPAGACRSWSASPGTIEGQTLPGWPPGRVSAYTPDDLNCSELMLAELECGETAGWPGRPKGWRRPLVARRPPDRVRLGASGIPRALRRGSPVRRGASAHSPRSRRIRADLVGGRLADPVHRQPGRAGSGQCRGRVRAGQRVAPPGRCAQPSAPPRRSIRHLQL
jgi:hypothetical protein